MNTNLLIVVILVIYVLHIVSSIPVPQDVEERRRKNKRRRRPCKRQNEESGRWFFGHDLTLFLGDVTICGGFPYTENTGSSGQYEGIIPHVTHRPHKPHRPHRPHRPSHGNHGNQDNTQVKPVEENIEEDYVQDEYYKPGPLVGALNNNVIGLEQNLSNLNNYTPGRIFTTISNHFNRIVNPFIDLFYR